MDRIRDFQHKHGLKADGIIGHNTLNKMMEVFHIPSKEKTAHFVGQVASETGNFRFDEENLNYSAEALGSVFRRYFKDYPERLEFAYNPQRIANRVYANRMGNGDELSGDGWKHRGFGALMVTGKRNQERFANKVRDLSILKDPSIIAKKYYWESALYYFDENNVWEYCHMVDNAHIELTSKKINLGDPYSRAEPNGLDERMKYTKEYYRLICK